MSRIGKRPVAIPSGVEAKIDNGILSVKGPKGTLTMGLSDLVSYKLEDGSIAVDPVNDTKPAAVPDPMTNSQLQAEIKELKEEIKEDKSSVAEATKVELIS